MFVLFGHSWRGLLTTLDCFIASSPEPTETVLRMLGFKDRKEKSHERRD